MPSTAARLKGGPGGSYGVRDSSMAANVAWIADEARKGVILTRPTGTTTYTKQAAA